MATGGLPWYRRLVWDSSLLTRHGVSEHIGFDLDCAPRRHEVFLADASVDELPVEHSRTSFTKESFWPAGRTTHTPPWMLGLITQQDGRQKARFLMLQMDYRGAAVPGRWRV